MQLFIHGRDNLANVQLRQASEYFDQAIQKDPDFAMAYLYRAQSVGGYNMAMDNIHKAVSLVDKVSSGEKMLIMATKASFEGNRIEEKSYVEQLDKAYPTDKWAQTQIGQFHYGNSDYKMALEHFNRALKADPNFAPPYNMIGYANSQLGDYNAAENAFKKYISLIPNDPNPYDSYAELLQKMGKYDESTVQYQKSLSIDPQFISSLKGIGDNYLFKGDYTKARDYYDQQYQKSTVINNKLGSLFWKAVSYVHEGNTQAALDIINKERDLANSHNLMTSVFTTHNSAAFILCETGEPDKALKETNMANDLIDEMQVSESMKENLTANVLLRKSFILAQQGDVDEASKVAQQAEKLVNKRQDEGQIKMLHFVEGITALQKDMNDDAISHFKMADNDSPLTWYYKAVAYQNSGNEEKSMEIYKKIAKWNVNGLDLALVRNKAMGKLKAAGMSAAD